LFVLTVYTFLDYEAFANALRSIDKNPAVTATIWQGDIYLFLPLTISF
jgi:hypothetical protein